MRFGQAVTYLISDMGWSVGYKKVSCSFDLVCCLCVRGKTVAY